MPRQSAEQAIYTWVDLPAQHRKVLKWTAMLIVVAFTAVIHAIFKTPWMTGAAAVVFMIAAADFWWPSTYTLTAEGVSKKGLLDRKTMLWTAVRAAELGDSGVRLSPAARPGLGRAYRGLYLPASPKGAPSLKQLVAEVERRATQRVKPEA
jgi:hypothetical protein